MHSWRRAVVILISALVASSVMIGWLVICLPHYQEIRNSFPDDEGNWRFDIGFLEFFALFFGSIFVAGRWSAKILIGNRAADEIAASGRWRTVPLEFFIGLLLIMTRWAAGKPNAPWTWDYLLQTALGALMILDSLYEAWKYWIAPRLKVKSNLE
jgi:hypothetical protein